MSNPRRITFRCKVPPNTLYTPDHAHEVLEMRKHPDYEELDANGEVVPLEDLLQRPTILVENAKTLSVATGRKAK